jgi:hypothetical protein
MQALWSACRVQRPYSAVTPRKWIPGVRRHKRASPHRRILVASPFATYCLVSTIVPAMVMLVGVGVKVSVFPETQYEYVAVRVCELLVVSVSTPPEVVYGSLVEATEAISPSQPD